MKLESLKKLREWISRQEIVFDNQGISALYVDRGDVEFLERNVPDAIQAEVDERYMPLPLDAEGVPIHVGDVMEYENQNDEDKPFTILGVNNDGDVFHCLEDKRPVPTCISLANCLRHVKHDQLKELLEELANEVWEASCTCQTTWSDSGLDGIEERYAERIRELMEVDE